MGKKRIVKKGGEESGKSGANAQKKLSRRKLTTGILYVQSTFNNTKILLTDEKGNAICSASSGSMGFKGAKKGTPFAAAKAAEVLAEKAELLGVKTVKVVVKGVGAGREASIRGFISKGVQVISITDETPVPFNGPKPPKPRRV
jgi:small subunit ribosomal protein S11